MGPGMWKACVRLCSTASAKPHQAGKKLGLANVNHIVAISSAKGGVGKSTTAANLAVALSTALELRVGLLDADIHGPSIGKMMNLKGKPELASKGQALMRPKENYRVKCMSMSFFVEDDQPIVWRGPMVNSAFDKLLKGTDWGHLDVLVVDMPPGTGDAQINLAQRIPLSGAVVVSTPQDIALLDARRGVQMFRKMNVPVLGLVENMSVYVCRKCGHEEHIFGEGGVQKMAQEFGVDVLGQIPLDVTIRERADAGAPVVAADPRGSCASAYITTAEQVYAKLQEQAQAHQGAPKIVFE